MVAAARRLERLCYERADAVTVLADDLQGQRRCQDLDDPPRCASSPTSSTRHWITPANDENAYRQPVRAVGQVRRHVRRERGPVPVDTISFSKPPRPSRTSTISCSSSTEAAPSETSSSSAAHGMPNVVFVDMQPLDRLPEVLAAADIHLVPLEARSRPIQRSVQDLLGAGCGKTHRGERRPRERGRPGPRTSGGGHRGSSGGCGSLHESDPDRCTSGASELASDGGRGPRLRRRPGPPPLRWPTSTRTFRRAQRPPLSQPLAPVPWLTGTGARVESQVRPGWKYFAWLISLTKYAPNPENSPYANLTRGGAADSAQARHHAVSPAGFGSRPMPDVTPSMLSALASIEYRQPVTLGRSRGGRTGDARRR